MDANHTYFWTCAAIILLAAYIDYVVSGGCKGKFYPRLLRAYAHVYQEQRSAKFFLHP